MTPPSSSPLGWSTKPRAYRPPRPSRGPISEALDRNSTHQCECRDCFRPRFKLSRFCKGHFENHARTGHPVAPHISRRTWGPFVQRSQAFVLEQLRAGHRSIEEAIRWLSVELAQAERPTDPNPSHLVYQAALLRAHRNGVSATDLLARVIASHLADDRGREVRPRFASDEHFAHQAACLYLLSGPFGKQGWSKRKRKREPQAPKEFVRLRWPVREYCHERVNGALGVLAIRASQAIQQRDP